jgi:hypothetical protein
MTYFTTPTAEAMRVIMRRLTRLGSPTQLERHRLKSAVTTATPEEVMRLGTELGVPVSFERARAPVHGAIALGRCHACGALRGDPCRTPSGRTRQPHRGRT